MMQQIANFIVDHDPMMVIRRTHDTVRYIRWEWNKEHAEMRDVYAEMCVRLLQSGIMLERGMVPDVSTYRSVFCTEGGDAPWMLDQAG